MRTLNSAKNTIVSITMSVVTILIGLITQKIFIKILGTEYLGLNGLFNNVLSMLSIAELGIGAAIVYSLYEPIAKKDKEKIKSLLKFYKISYRAIAFIVLIIGIIVIPFLPIIVGENNIKENINLIYILFLTDTVISYLLTYKRSILQSNEKAYVINIIHILYLIFMNTSQIILLIITKNYILYLTIKILFRMLENIVITIVANRMYPFITEKNIKNIDRNLKKDIFKKVKGLLFHKIGGFVVSGTDNIIISAFLGVATVGLYTNYFTIINAVGSLFSQIFTSLVASVGNLLTEKNIEKNYIIYKDMLFINVWMYSFSSIALLCLIEPFIKIWIGGEYLLEYGVLITLCINFYWQGMRKTISVFKDAAGIFHEDRFMPIYESIINILASLILLKFFGLKGVFIGTILSTLFLFIYAFPKYIYKPIFKKDILDFCKDYLKYFLITVIIALITVLLTNSLKFDNNFVQLIINGIIVLIVPNCIMFILFRKKEEFKYVERILFSFLKNK